MFWAKRTMFLISGVMDLQLWFQFTHKTDFYVQSLTACLHCWMGLIQFDPDLFLNTVYTTKPNLLQSAKKLEPTIIIFIEYRQVSRHDKVASVGDFSILWSWFIRRLHAYLSPFVFLETVLPYHCLYAALLLHFINTVAILVVLLRIFIPCFRAKSFCRFATVYTGWLEQTRSNQTHISQSSSARFSLIQLVFTLTYKLI